MSYEEFFHFDITECNYGKHESDNDDEKEVEVPVVPSKEAKYFTIELCTFFEQLKTSKKKKYFFGGH